MCYTIYILNNFARIYCNASFPSCIPPPPKMRHELHFEHLPESQPSGFVLKMPQIAVAAALHHRSSRL